jgi:hypothetical protein
MNRKFVLLGKKEKEVTVRMRKQKEKAAREMRAIVKLRKQAAKKLQDVLEDEDWFLTADVPVQGGNEQGYWVPVMVWVETRKTRKTRTRS